MTEGGTFMSWNILGAQAKIVLDNVKQEDLFKTIAIGERDQTAVCRQPC